MRRVSLSRDWTATPRQVCVATIALYALMVLVLAPEGAPSRRARALALFSIVAGCCGAQAAARWAPRWSRGTGTLLAGFVALVVAGGAVGERALRDVSLSNFLGICAGLSGLALVVAGWHESLRYRIVRAWARIAVAALATFLIAQLLLIPAGWAIMATNRGAPPLSSGRTPAVEGLLYQEVRFPSFDGKRLAAWWVPPQNGTAVIVLTGSGSTRDDVLPHAGFLARAGYGVLIPDFRGHGESPGRAMEFGWGAERDLSAAVSYALARPGITRGVGVLGLSLGGMVGITAAAQDPRIRAVVAEGPTARTWADERLNAGVGPIRYASQWMMYHLLGVFAPEPEPIPLTEAVRRLEVPVLMIAGMGEREAQLVARYAAAAPDRVVHWSPPNTPHTQALYRNRKQYRQRVLDLFRTALGPATG